MVSLSFLFDLTASFIYQIPAVSKVLQSENDNVYM